MNQTKGFMIKKNGVNPPMKIKLLFLGNQFGPIKNKQNIIAKT